MEKEVAERVREKDVVTQTDQEGAFIIKEMHS